jgi:hypothetical protein
MGSISFAVMVGECRMKGPVSSSRRPRRSQHGMPVKRTPVLDNVKDLAVASRRACWARKVSSAVGFARALSPCTIRSQAAAITATTVVGVDDPYISPYTDPPLTTVRQPMRQMGRMAMETLLQIFAGAESGHDIKVPGELIVRQSTALPKESK